MTDKPNIPPQKPGEGSKDYRKRIHPDYKKKRSRNNTKDRFKGLTDDQIRAKVQQEDAKRAQDAEDEKLDQDVELNKQREDMRQGDYLRDPEGENGFSYRHALKIGMQAAQTARMIQTFPYRAAGGVIKALTIGNTLGSYR